MFVYENSQLVEVCCAQVGQLSNLTAWKATVGKFFNSASEVRYSPTSLELVSVLMMSCCVEPIEFMCFHETVGTHPATVFFIGKAIRHGKGSDTEFFANPS